MHYRRVCFFFLNSIRLHSNSCIVLSSPPENKLTAHPKHALDTSQVPGGWRELRAVPGAHWGPPAAPIPLPLGCSRGLDDPSPLGFGLGRQTQPGVMDATEVSGLFCCFVLSAAFQELLVYTGSSGCPLPTATAPCAPRARGPTRFVPARTWPRGTIKMFDAGLGWFARSKSRSRVRAAPV